MGGRNRKTREEEGLECDVRPPFILLLEVDPELLQGRRPVVCVGGLACLFVHLLERRLPLIERALALLRRQWHLVCGGWVHDPMFAFGFDLHRARARHDHRHRAFDGEGVYLLRVLVELREQLPDLLCAPVRAQAMRHLSWGEDEGGVGIGLAGEGGIAVVASTWA